MRFVPSLQAAGLLAFVGCALLGCPNKDANDANNFQTMCQPGQPCPCQPGQPGCSAMPPQCPAGQQVCTCGQAGCLQPPQCQPGQPSCMAAPPPPPSCGGPGQPACQQQTTGACTAVPLLAIGGQAVLDGLATTDFPGMHSEGTFTGTCQTGQTMEQPFTAQPGKCYGAIGLGLTATQVDLQIVISQPPLPPVVMQQSSGTGPKAEIGAGGNCWRSMSPIPVPAKLVMKMTGGMGLAGGEILSK